MKPLICKQCGGQINRETYICTSCGTAYELPPIHVHEMVCEDPRFVTVAAVVEIDNYLLGGGYREEVIEHTLHDIAHQLGEAMLPIAEFRTDNMYDPLRFKSKIEARVRVKRPESDRLLLRYNDSFNRR